MKLNLKQEDFKLITIGFLPALFSLYIVSLGLIIKNSSIMIIIHHLYRYCDHFIYYSKQNGFRVTKLLYFNITIYKTRNFILHPINTYQYFTCAAYCRPVNDYEIC